jgi:hypothetical protein
MARQPTCRQISFVAGILIAVAGARAFGNKVTVRPQDQMLLMEVLAADFKLAREMNDAFWAEFKNVVKEVGAMTPVFAAPDPEWTPKVELAGESKSKLSDVQYRLKRPQDGGHVLLMVNAGEHPVAVRVGAPTWAGKKVLGWQGTLAPQVDKAGRWVETIEPFGVRVYADRRSPSRGG